MMPNNIEVEEEQKDTSYDDSSSLLGGSEDVHASGLSSDGVSEDMVKERRKRVDTSQGTLKAMREAAEHIKNEIMKNETIPLPVGPTIPSVEFLALNLACTKQFYTIMCRQYPDTSEVLRQASLQEEWIYSIHVPQTKRCFPRNEPWYQHYRHELQEIYEPLVILRAQEVYMNLPITSFMPGNPRVYAPTTSQDLDLNRLQDCLFQYQHTRFQLLDAEKRCLRQISSLIKSQTTAVCGNYAREIDGNTSQKLGYLQEAASESRSLLSLSKLETVIIHEIDILLSNARGSLPQIRSQTYAQDVSLIMNYYEFFPNDLNYLQHSTPLKHPSMKLEKKQGPRRRWLKGRTSWLNTSRGLHYNLEIPPSFTELDGYLVSLVPQIINNIDTSRFFSNMGCFVELRHRNPVVEARLGAQGAAEGTLPASWEYWKIAYKVPANRLEIDDLFYDNIFHAKTLFEMLQHEDLPLDCDRESLKTSWSRILALIAINYGCTSEPAFFLTTMDRILSEMRLAVGSTGISLDRGNGHPLGPQRRYLEVFTELTLFIRGSIICAVFSSWGSEQCPQTRLSAYQSLFRWNSKCATCGKELELPLNSRHPKETIQVGMKDIRVGNDTLRSEISTNRGDIYDCFSKIACKRSSSQRWSQSLGPFFFYFADLYHLGCKTFREKQTALF